MYSDPRLVSIIEAYKREFWPSKLIPSKDTIRNPEALTLDKYHTYNCRLLHLYCICAFNTRESITSLD